MSGVATTAVGPCSAEIEAVHRWQQTWPAPAQQHLDSWRLRSAAGITKRANSALALPTAAPLPRLVDAAADFFAARGLPPVVVEHDHLPVVGLERLLTDRGWHGLEPDPVLTAPIGSLRLEPDPAAEVTVRSITADADGPVRADPDWLRCWASSRGTPDLAESPVAAALVWGSPVTITATARTAIDRTAIDGPILAIGRIGVSGEWAGLNCLWTHPDRRGTGLGTAVIAALVAAAGGYGARQVQLAVESGNHRARRLYERLGFRRRCHYRYWLARTPPAGSLPPPGTTDPGSRRSTR